MRKNHGFARPLADLVGQTIDPVLAQRGFGQSQLITYWDEIVGDRLAAMSQPIKLQWPPRAHAAQDRKSASATLIVRVESGFALELQHCADLVIDRVNAYFGWRCVSRLGLKQGPVARKIRTRTHSAVDPAAARAAADLARPIEDEALRLALERLGARVLSERSSGADEAAAPRSIAASNVTEKSFDFPRASSSLRPE